MGGTGGRDRGGRGPGRGRGASQFARYDDELGMGKDGSDPCDNSLRKTAPAVAPRESGPEEIDIEDAREVGEGGMMEETHYSIRSNRSDGIHDDHGESEREVEKSGYRDDSDDDGGRNKEQQQQEGFAKTTTTAPTETATIAAEEGATGGRRSTEEDEAYSPNPDDGTTQVEEEDKPFSDAGSNSSREEKHTRRTSGDDGGSGGDDVPIGRGSSSARQATESGGNHSEKQVEGEDPVQADVEKEKAEEAIAVDSGSDSSSRGQDGGRRIREEHYANNREENGDKVATALRRGGENERVSSAETGPDEHGTVPNSGDSGDDGGRHSTPKQAVAETKKGRWAEGAASDGSKAGSAAAVASDEVWETENTADTSSKRRSSAKRRELASDEVREAENTANTSSKRKSSVGREESTSSVVKEDEPVAAVPAENKKKRGGFFGRKQKN